MIITDKIIGYFPERDCVAKLVLGRCFWLVLLFISAVIEDLVRISLADAKLSINITIQSSGSFNISIIY